MSEPRRHQNSWKTLSVQCGSREIHRVAQEDHWVLDRCVRYSHSATDRMGWTIKTVSSRKTNSPSDQPVDGFLQRIEQVHSALSAVTERESCSGLEEVQRSVRRWDLLSGGMRRALLRQELVHRYEKSRARATTATLDEDIKTAALEALVPSELEQHLATNRTRLMTYEQVRG